MKLFSRAFWLRRLREPSTWAGIITITTAIFGITVSPEQRDAIIGAGVALAGVLMVFLRESGSETAELSEAEKVREAIARAGIRGRADVMRDVQPERSNNH